MKKSGFDAFSLVFGLVVVMIVATVAMNVGGAVSGSSSVSFGINGMAEMRCIDGYRFVIGAEGNARQVLDEFGKGAKCK